MIPKKSLQYGNLMLKKHFWLLLTGENSFIFLWKLKYIVFSGFLIIESSKEQHLFEIEIFCNIINVLLSL